MHKTTHPLLRLLKHRWFDERDAARALGPQGLARIEGLVAESEHHHNGQIRVCVEAGLPTSYIRRRASAHERALALFGKLGVWDTEQNNGVLIYLLLAEHTIANVADRGLACGPACALAALPMAWPRRLLQWTPRCAAPIRARPATARVRPMNCPTGR